MQHNLNNDTKTFTYKNKTATQVNSRGGKRRKEQRKDRNCLTITVLE